MLVATFGPTTAWHGREIIWDEVRFVLVGHGTISAAAVLEYERMGHLIWATAEMRPWVVSVAQWETGTYPNANAQPYSAARPTGQAKAGGKLPTWALVVIILGVVAVVGGMLLAILIPMFALRTGETIVNNAAVRSGARSIQMSLESWAAEHAGAYPDADAVNSVGLSRYITNWPTNPYTDLPMSPGTGPGCFRYEVGSGGGTYRLTVYGRDGTVILDLRGGGGTTV
jgi:hypothetical protein